MAPSWSRLRPSGSSNSNTNPSPTQSRTTPQQEKASPRPPPSQSNAFDPPPTLHHAQAPSSPQRPHTSGGADRHSHGRSVSHPLPKIFGRKKSGRDLRGYNDTDVPLDDDLVPVLDDPVGGSPQKPTPTRVISGNKGKKPGEDAEGKVFRRCMCCDSRVGVPKELDRFRCLECLTINDMRPLAEQKEMKERAGVDGKKAETFPGGLPPGVKVVPLSVQKTRAIIDRCLLTYLEARCRRVEEPSVHTPKPADGQSDTSAIEKAATTPAISTDRRESAGDAKQLTDAPLSSSPPDTPGSDDGQFAPTATIRNYTDIDQFAFMRMDTPPPDRQPVAHGPGPPSTVSRMPLPPRPNRKPPPPPVKVTNRTPSQRMQPNGSTTPNGQPPSRVQMSPRPTPAELEQRKRYERVKTIFRPLEDYMVATFGDYQCLNTSFSTVAAQRPVLQGRTRSDGNVPTTSSEPVDESGQLSSFGGLSELDAKTLLLGDLGENSSWWTGKLDRYRSEKGHKHKKIGEGTRKAVSSKTPNIDWTELCKWYDIVHSAGDDWRSKLSQLSASDPVICPARLEALADDIEEDLAEAAEHASRALLKITETVLKRPTQMMTQPEHVRWLLIILANPDLYPRRGKPRRVVSGGSTLHPVRSHSDRQNGVTPSSPKQLSPPKSPGREAGQHTGILKRAFGLLAYSTENCHRYLIGWFSRFDEERLVRLIDLVAGFVTHRVASRSSRPRSKSAVADGGLIPDLSGSAANTSLQLHSAMGLSGSVKKRNEPEGETVWANDWQVEAAAKFMSLLFAANNIWQGQRRGDGSIVPRVDSVFAVGGDAHTTTSNSRTQAKRSGQLLHTSTFYNTLLDYHDLIADFKVWESKREKFSFCQYPLFLSMGAKIKILEYDARRQMEIKAREAYFDSVIRQRALDGYFHLRVRRDCMVDDSLRQISEAVGAGQEELKKGLRVHFTGEEGVDAGGPRKEWFLMLVREIFDPEHGMFVYDDESHTCYFNPNSFETSDQYYLVGALLGLAIYNSTILDVAFPPFAFRKLLAAAPSGTSSSNVSSLTGTKGQMTYTVADLAEFRPSLAAGLQQLLDFDGDVEATYCRDFVAPVERYGSLTNVPLIPNGEGTPVTNANRHEFVDAYIRYLLDTSVARQFEPFKRGFFTVCAGNALSLFRAEEIELLVRGSDEALDVASLKAVAVYENWRHFQPPHAMLPQPAETVPVLQWFWDIFAEASPDRQRKLLAFITGSDRIPAVGATSLVLRIVAGGDGWGGGGKEERTRFPVARTCFNMLVLWRYDYREALEEKLWRAVEESEGFGLK